MCVDMNRCMNAVLTFGSCQEKAGMMMKSLNSFLREACCLGHSNDELHS